MQRRMVLAPCNSSFDSYIANLTSSYVDQSNEASIVSTSIFILLLTGIFFNLNLLRRLSDLSAVLNPSVQRFLSSVLSIFLPVMSYLFSEAKNSDPSYARLQSLGLKPDLPRRAGVILVWMLLVELLRNNVEKIRMRGYKTSGLIQRAGRVVWLGSLVFFNVRSAGRKAIYGGLWILCTSKLVQRVAYTETGKRSYLHNKNSRLIASYMSRVLTRGRREHPVTLAEVLTRNRRSATVHADVGLHVQVEVVEPAAVHGHGGGDHDLLERCEYIVMGEEKLVKDHKITPDAGDSSIVTVGDVWTKLPHKACHGYERLRRLCLSFALFKLLRRRFDHRGDMSVEEARDCRELIFKGMCKCNNGAAAAATKEQAETVFQVMNDEVNFLCEYYHSIVPVVLASPFFLLSNYLLLPVVLFCMWLMTIVLCGNGDLTYAFRSINTDNYTLNFGITKLTMCLLGQVTSSPQAFFSMVDLSITSLLSLIFLYEEVWEFFLFVLSNWFLISLLRNYISNPKWRGSSAFVGALRCIVWVRGKIRHSRKLRFKQFCALDLRRPLIIATPACLLSLTVQSVRVPNKVKHSIVEYLMKHDPDDGANLSNGMSALEKHMDLFPRLSWACQSESVAEVILTWHIATSLFLQARHKEEEEAAGLTSSAAVVATRLSEYCAYLVVFHPELLPDSKDKTERVFIDMKEELRSSLGFVDYYFLGRDARATKILETVQAQEEEEEEEEAPRWTENKVLKNGATLAKVLMENATTTEKIAEVWKMLGNVWTELMVYVAPSSDEVHMKGHASLLVKGGEFVTLLWALTTHTGFSRPPTTKPTPSIFTS